MANLLIGRSGNLALYANDSVGVVIDTSLGMVVNSGQALSLFQSMSWETPKFTLNASETLLGDRALENYAEDALIASADRMFSIPKSVQSEAQKALDWHKEHHRGGTSVGLNTARTLAKGGQVGLRKVRHIAKYFPRHEVDKKGKGWAPGEDNFPSNGRIAWALWGGDAGQRWASAIVEREEKSLTAGAYGFVKPQLTPFQEAHMLDENYGPEFLARVDLDGSGIDRLYKIDIDGRVYVWDDECWDDLGSVDGDIWTYDKTLDDPYSTSEKTHVLVDPSSALLIAARLATDPYHTVSVLDLDADEAQLVALGLAEEDWSTIDMAVTAAATKQPSAGNNLDGVDTPEEKSARASSQVRDAGGLFAKTGTPVVIGGDVERGSGVITGIDSTTGKVSVKLNSGATVEVDAKQTRAASDKNAAQPKFVDYELDKPLDVSGILGEPRTPIDQPQAHLPGTLPPMTKADLHQLLTDWPSYVSKQRNSYKAIDSADEKRAYSPTPNAGPTAPNAAPIVSAADEKPMTPETSDVTPKYLAIVAQEAPDAVMDLVAIVPQTASSTAPATYKRQDKKWVYDEQIYNDLTSATPPPVIELDKVSVNDVLTQMDETGDEKPETISASALVASVDAVFTSFFAGTPVTAAGGLDRNRGNAEELRQYWTHGKGAAKIRWGTPGDWTRCVRNLSKYMGPRAKGYCQLRHKEATGIFTGDRNNPGNDFAIEAFDTAFIEAAALTARANEARERFGLTASAEMTGAKFRIPLVIPEDLESGDGRKFKSEAIEIRELPLPLMWQIKTGEGHNGSVVVGRIDYMERTENGIGNAYGVFDTGAYGREAERLVRNGFIRGVSADLDQFEAKEDKPEVSENAEGPEDIGKQKLTINHARVMAATIVAKPAFQECSIFIEDDNAGDQEETMIPDDGIYEESIDPNEALEVITASGFLDAPIPMTPPQDWFEKPALTKATPLTVDPDGRVYGHIAAWHVNHIGMPRSTRPPRSKSKYAYFHTGVVRTDLGKDIPVGQLTLAGGHASLNANAAAAAKHYDDTASAIADVHAGEDDYGIWVAGCLRPDATEAQIRALRASAPSGDWRPINGQLELVAVCQVNVPGFPIARAMVASGKVMALVAAGAHYMAMIKNDPVTQLSVRAAVLNELSSQTTAMNIEARIEAAKNKVWSDFSYMSRDERMALAGEGKAFKDGSFPIESVDDLRNAIQAFGRAKDANKADLKKFIKKRARQLNARHLIPEEWTKESSFAASEKVTELRQRAMIAAAVAELASITGEELEGLIASGGAMPNGMLPIRNEGDLKNALNAYNSLKSGDRFKARKHIAKRAKALGQLSLLPNSWKTASTDEATASVEKMRSVIASITEFAEKVEEISEADLKKLKEVKAEADKQTEEEVKIAEDIRTGKTTAKEVYDEEGRSKYTPKTQPRDARGKYRKVLARLKQNLGVAGLQDALKKAEAAENLEFAGNYTESAKASKELLDTVDRLDTKALNPEALENVRLSTAQLGKTIANLPLPFGSEADKLKFSDLPSGLKDLIDKMITRVEAKIGKKDADIATQDLRSYMSGADFYNQAEIQSQMNKLLRLLT